MLKIIHLSDIHYDNKNNGSEHINLVDKLLLDLKKIVDSDTLLVITGDMIDKGGEFNTLDSISPYDIFSKKIIERILTEYPILTNRILTIPGNHDVQRSKIDKIKYRGLMDIIKNNYDELDQYIDLFIKNEYFDQLSTYKKFENELNKNNKNYFSNNLYSIYKNKINDINVGIACLNSSWLCCDNNDLHNIALGEKQLNNAIDDISESDIKIAILHHPIEFFCEKDREIIQPLFYKYFDLILTGHTHKLDSSMNQNLHGNLFISTAESVFTKKIKSENTNTGYSILKIFPKEKYVIKFRKYPNHGDRFVSNTDVGTDSGEITFTIPTNEECAVDNKVYNIIKNLEKSHLDFMNKDLIIYNADDNVPNCINDVFVCPTICNFLENQCDDEDTIKKYTIEQIILSDENFLIYGQKESGKTIFLDKVIIDLVTNFNKYKIIPIHIRFEEMGNHDILQIIRNFLSIDKKEFDEIYSRFKLILVIDNIKFPHENNGSGLDYHNLKKLVKFTEEYSSIHIIASSNQISESIFPTDHFEYNQYFDFNVSFLHTLKTAQIKSLINKWFTNRDINFQDNLEKLFNTFKDLGLPKTPLSVTMFLWIINKQEKEPVNNAVLVEIFIENLLEKANFSNAYSRSFDFYNKKRLLTKFSKYIFDNGDIYQSYSLSYEKSLDFFRKYLEQKYGNPKIILDSFIERHILLLTDNSQVRFKSGFFFHYFLAANIETDDDFKSLVFDNILDFANEIEFYTGLKRDSDETVNLIFDKVKENFDNFNSTILPQFKKIDQFFETDKPLSSYIDMTRAKNKPTEEQLDKAYDDRLDLIPVRNDISPKEFNRKISHELDSLLKLASIVLKNSEEIDSFDKRFNFYQLIIKSSISFLVLYRQHMLDYFSKNKEKPHYFPKNIDFDLFLRFLPLIHQIVIYDWIGTVKLSPILLKKMELDLKDNSISDYEKFLSVFIYADINGSNYRDHINKFLKSIKHNYLLDSVFFKLLSYYYLRPGSKDSDKYYLDSLTFLKIKSGRLNRSQREVERLKLRYYRTKNSEQ